MPRATIQPSSVGGFRNLPRHSSGCGWRLPMPRSSLLLWRRSTSRPTAVAAAHAPSFAWGPNSPRSFPSGGPVAPPPPPCSLCSHPRHGGRGQGRAVSLAALGAFLSATASKSSRGLGGFQLPGLSASGDRPLWAWHPKGSCRRLWDAAPFATERPRLSALSVLATLVRSPLFDLLSYAHFCAHSKSRDKICRAILYRTTDDFVFDFK